MFIILFTILTPENLHSTPLNLDHRNVISRSKSETTEDEFLAKPKSEMVVTDEEVNGEVVDSTPQVSTLNWKIGFRNLLVENATFRAGHYRLYKHELMKVAFASKEDLLKFKSSFEEAKLTKLNEISEDNLEEFAEIIWENICEDPDEMDKLMTFASGRDHSLWNLINEEILPDSLKYYVMFFVGDPMKMDMITKTLEPIPLCDRLFQSEYECVVKKVRELMICKCMLFASIIGYPYFAGIV
uniref:BACK domain-containing protein n=1 Tax=Ascaris lumbricoides TaxID=6252 RepID=A0A0M3IPZ6_ASCLU